MRRLTDEIRRTFVKSHSELCLARAKITLIVGISVVPLFAGLDFILTRDHFKEFLLLRLVTTCEAAIMLVLIHFSKPFALRFSNFLVALYGISLGCMISYMSLQLGGFNSSYYVGIIIVILAASVVMPWAPPYQLFMTAGMYLSYLSQILIVGINASLGTFINNNYFLLAAIGITYMASVLQYRMHRLLHDKDQAKSTFFANVSHELKTPMTLVVTPLDNLIQKLPKTASEVILSRQTFETVRHNAYRLSGLISDILDLTKSEIGKARISPVEIPDSRGFVENICNSVRPLMEERGLQFEFVVGPPPEEVKKG